jgi:hypothetical protein
MAGKLFIQHGNPIWLSPSIWLTMVGSSTPTFTAVGGPSTNGITGTVKNTINVQVDLMGGGTDPNLVRVDSYVCVPTTGVGPGGQTLVSAGGASGLFGTDAATPAQPFPQVVTMDWYPTNVEAGTNGGHLCIGANAYDSAGDGQPISYPAVLDLTDQHMAQRNISIVPAAQSHTPTWLSANFFIPQADVFPPGTVTTSVIKVEPVPIERVLSQVVREQLLMSSRVALTGGRGAEAPAGNGHEPPQRTLLRGGGDLVLARTQAKIVPSQKPAPQVLLQGPCGFSVEQDVELQPRKPLPITAVFQVTPDDPGEVFEFDVVHLLSSGQVLGGIRVVVVTVTDDGQGPQ